jgi:uracil-DNA glycosylase
MKIDQFIQCEKFPCNDVLHQHYIVPSIDVKPNAVSIVLISEAAPANPADYYYAPGNPLFAQTTIQAFNDAGATVKSIQDILKLGVYLTTAVKCGKNGYNISAGTINECSLILEKELALFPKIQVYLLMGDVAIKSLNYIAKRIGEHRIVPAGSTYKIRGQEYFFQGARVFPSYVQAGPAFLVEKSKRKMIAQDIANALKIIKQK